MKFDHELGDYKEAREMVVTALVGIAQKWRAKGRDQTASLEVLDEEGGLVCRVSLTLRGDWLH